MTVVSGAVIIESSTSWFGTLQIYDSSVNISQGIHNFFGSSSITGNGTLQIQNTAAISIGGSLDVDYFTLTTGGASVTVNSPSATQIEFDQFLMLGGSFSGNKAIVKAFSWGGGNIQVNSLQIGQLEV